MFHISLKKKKKSEVPGIYFIIKNINHDIFDGGFSSFIKKAQTNGNKHKFYFDKEQKILVYGNVLTTVSFLLLDIVQVIYLNTY